jgi:acetate kinase
MQSKILVINIGSASKKYALYDGLDEIIFFHFEKLNEKEILSIKSDSVFSKDKITEIDYENSLEFLCNYLKEHLNVDIEDILALSFRVVAPSSFFLEHREIDQNYLTQFEQVKESAGLHTLPILEEIQKAKRIFKNKKLFGISDSAFYKNKLEESKYYGVSKKLQDELDLKRFGYHGISVESVINKMESLENINDKKILVCHLGGGISFTAINNKKPLDNSMGFSPLEGPVMATRSGSLDYVFAKEFLEKQNINDKYEQISYLMKNSGIFGLSGISNDLRVLRDELFKGNNEARFALKVYLFNIIKEIGKMTAVLKGLDTIVFTGTIGFRSDFLRELILEELRWLGCDYDLNKNCEGDISGSYFYIESSESKVKILVCETNEMEQIAKISLRLL